MKSHRVGDGERSLAVFIDFENMGLGFGNRRDRFEINKVLERLVEKGKIVCKKAYADWSRFGMYTGALHEAAIELIEIPRRGITGKNSADIRLVVDAIDLAYSKDHIDTFVIVSGDSDFSPLVSKLKELGKHVIGLGLVDATSDLLRDNCDEFIYYEDLDRAPIIPVGVNEAIPERKRKVFALLLDSLLALRRENKEVIYSSMVKDTMKRKKPSFNEEYYGYRTFSDLLEDAQREGVLELEKHKGSGMYIVTRFGLELKGSPSAAGNGSGAKLPRPASPPQPERGEPRGREAGRSGERPAPRDQGQGRGRRGDTPATPPPPVSRPESEPPPSRVDRPLGRELVEDIDVLDDESVDEVPSYGPGRKPAAPPKAPPKPAARAPKAEPKQQPQPKQQAKQEPKRGRGAAKSEGPGRGSGGRRRSAEPAASTPPPPAAPAPRSAAKPAEDEDEFGAGLD
jgi:uncharacterized protein (TIGR00288 family)